MSARKRPSSDIGDRRVKAGAIDTRHRLHRECFHDLGDGDIG